MSEEPTVWHDPANLLQDKVKEDQQMKRMARDVHAVRHQLHDLIDEMYEYPHSQMLLQEAALLLFRAHSGAKYELKHRSNET